MNRDLDDDDNWRKQMLTSFGVVVAVALIIGVVIGIVTLGAVNVLGLGSSSQTASAPPSLVLPPLESRAPDSEAPLITVSPTPTPSSAAPSPSASPTKKKPTGIVLSASTGRAAPYERIYLTGRYPGGSGRTLVVQRFAGGWRDFPVDTTVSGGRFSTYIQSGNDGPNRFRVVDPSTGKHSNPVTIVIG